MGSLEIFSYFTQQTGLGSQLSTVNAWVVEKKARLKLSSDWKKTGSWVSVLPVFACDRDSRLSELIDLFTGCWLVNILTTKDLILSSFLTLFQRNKNHQKELSWKSQSLLRSLTINIFKQDQWIDYKITQPM